MAAIGVPATTSTANTIAGDANTTVIPSLHHHFKVSFHVSSKPKLRFVSKGMHSVSSHSVALKAKLNKALDEPSNDTATPIDKDVSSAREVKNAEPATGESTPPALPTKDSINEFLSQVASIVKLVDSRDIAELQLKQLDCELLIRKREAISPSSAPVPSVPAVSHYVAPSVPAPAPVPPPPPPPPAVSLAPPALAAATKPSHSSPPALKCPMSGTFYRSPAPGEPPFVKVGDKVQKGQVLCIVEAMKLMNEIEADQSGTIVEILVEDRKPVGIEQPLFVIQP